MFLNDLNSENLQNKGRGEQINCRIDEDATKVSCGTYMYFHAQKTFRRNRNGQILALKVEMEVP